MASRRYNSRRQNLGIARKRNADTKKGYTKPINGAAGLTGSNLMARDEDGSPHAGPGDALAGGVLKERTVEIVMRPEARAPSARRCCRHCAHCAREIVFGAVAGRRFT